MINTVFVSPGIISSEKVYNAHASKAGKTKMGIVGIAPKGPAFEPVRISSTDEYVLRFGPTNPDFPMSYVGCSFLEQSKELTVTRVLGQEGYTNSPAWLVLLETLFAYTGSVEYNTYSFSAVKSYPFTYQFTVTLNSLLSAGTINVDVVADNINVEYNGTITAEDYIAALSASTEFTDLNIFISGGPSSGATISDGDNFSLLDTFVGTAPNANCWVWGSENITFEELNIPFGMISDSCGYPSPGMSVAVIRSKKNPLTGEFFFKEETDVEIGLAAGILQPFNLSGTTGPFTAYTNSGITVSLDETSDDYIVKVLGRSPKWREGAHNLYIERIYPNFVRESAVRGIVANLYKSLTFRQDPEYTDFVSQYTNAITPWIVSRVIGNDVKRLFRFHTISDGNASNSEIKISLANIDPEDLTFDVLVRDFNDLDSEMVVIERFSSVCLDSSAPNFIGRYIGTTSEEFPSKSKFIKVEMAASFIERTVPAGFEGYEQKSSEVDQLIEELPPLIYYNTSYSTGDTISKTFLGISEYAYSGFSKSRASRVKGIKRLDADLFSYLGANGSGRTTTKGFHMENIADSNFFFSGDKISLTSYTTSNGLYLDKQKLKFTVCPAGGFDGWDVNKYYENLYEQFAEEEFSNVEAFKMGIDTMGNPDAVDINLIATPGVDFYNNESIIKYAIDVVENRADVFYVIDAPRINNGSIKGTPEELVSLMRGTGIDTSYAATYWPWLQIEDANTGKNSYQAPTFLATKSIARTDKLANLWSAPAGIIRASAGGLTIKPDVILDKSQRDTLYANKINPVARLQDGTIAIFGQKTLQTRQSALDRINVRRLLLHLRKVVSIISASLVFEQNDQKLRDQFLAKIDPLLNDIKNKEGLYGYRIVMDKPKIGETITEENTLTGLIQLQPTRSVEFIELVYQILPTGARFEDF